MDVVNNSNTFEVVIIDPDKYTLEADHVFQIVTWMKGRAWHISPGSWNMYLKVKKYYWVKQPPDLLTTYFLSKIDGFHLPKSDI